MKTAFVSQKALVRAKVKYVVFSMFFSNSTNFKKNDLYIYTDFEMLLKPV